MYVNQLKNVQKNVNERFIVIDNHSLDTTQKFVLTSYEMC